METKNKTTYFYTCMELIERFTFSDNWITITLASCFLILALVKWVYKNEFNHLMSAALSDRYIKVSRNEHPNDFLRVAVVSVYITMLALWIVKIAHTQGSIGLDLDNFLLIVTAISVFILFKRYLSMLVATLLQFDDLLELVEYHRNTYRAVLGVFLLLLNLILYYGSPLSDSFLWGISLLSVVIMLCYNFIILYTYYNTFLKHGVYFIMYLCTLEIAPYLLLYKYIMLSRAY